MNEFAADNAFINHGSAGPVSTGLYQTKWEVTGAPVAKTMSAQFRT